MKKIFVFGLSILVMFLAMACVGPDTFEPGNVAETLTLSTVPATGTVTIEINSTDFLKYSIGNEIAAVKDFAAGATVEFSEILPTTAAGGNGLAAIDFNTDTYEVESATLTVYKDTYDREVSRWPLADRITTVYEIAPTLTPVLDDRGAGVVLNTIKDWTVSFTSPVAMKVQDDPFRKDGVEHERYALIINLRATPYAFRGTLTNITPTREGTVTQLQNGSMAGAVPLPKGGLSAYSYQSKVIAQDGTEYVDNFDTPVTQMILFKNSNLNPNALNTYTDVQYITGDIADEYIASTDKAYVAAAGAADTVVTADKLDDGGVIKTAGTEAATVATNGIARPAGYAAAAGGVARPTGIAASTYLKEGSLVLASVVGYKYWIIPIDTVPVAIK